MGIKDTMNSDSPSSSSEPEEESSPSSSEKNAPETDSVRLHKLLAHRGVASRRKAEQLVASGLVSVNGQIVTEPGTRVNPETDTVLVEGKPLRRESEPFLFLFYKPRGVVSTLHDPEGRPTLREFFPNIEPLLHVGRLDFQTEGALLLTNNGDLSQRILHPRYAIPRTYLVKIQGGVSPAHIERIARGDIRLDGRPVVPLEFVPERDTDSNAWYRITLTEGRNREVRRLFETLNYFVLKLVRTAFGPLTLAGLEPGEYRTVTASEIRTLLAGETPIHLPRTLDSRHRPSDSSPARSRKNHVRSTESFENTIPRRHFSGEDSSFERSERFERPSRSPRTFRDEGAPRSDRRPAPSQRPSRESDNERPRKRFSGEGSSPQDRSERFERPSRSPRTFRDEGAPRRKETSPFAKRKNGEDSRSQKQEKGFSKFTNRKSGPKGRGGPTNPSRPKKT